MIARCCRCHTMFAQEAPGAARCPECGLELWSGEGEPPAALVARMPEPRPAPQARVRVEDLAPRPDPPPTPLSDLPHDPPGDDGDFDAELQQWFDRRGPTLGEPAPWEEEGDPALQRFVSTVHAVLRQPADFFAALRPTGEDGILNFAILAIAPALAIVALGQLLALKTAGIDVSQIAPELQGSPLVQVETLETLYFSILVFAPVISAVLVYICASIYQMGLFLAVGPGRAYEVTFRVAVYGMAPMVLLVIPVVGLPLAAGVTAWAHATGLSRMHKIPAWAGIAVVVAMWMLFGMLALMVTSGILQAAGWLPAEAAS